MYYFVKLSSGWFGKEIEDVQDGAEHIQCHAENGDIVVVCDDIEAFTELMQVDRDEIQFV